MKNRNYWNLSKRMFLALWEEEKNNPIPPKYGFIPTECANYYQLKRIGNWSVELVHGSKLGASMTIINIRDKSEKYNVCSLQLVYKPCGIKLIKSSDTGYNDYKGIKKLFDVIIKENEKYKEVI